MPLTATDSIKAWSAPALLTLSIALAGAIWVNQQNRINQLELESADYRSALAVIAETQRNSAADRTAFQISTTQRLDKMQDILTTVGESLSALSALNQRQERDLGRGQ